MARALRRVSVERGVDPRSCVLVAFGGGGPLHACGLADRIGATRILVPPHAGVLSALGLAMTAERREGMHSVMRTLGDVTSADLAQWMREAESRCGAEAGWTREWLLRARFAGQGHELDVPAAPGDAPDAVKARFAELHRARVGFDLPVDVEVVSVRCTAHDTPRHAAFERRGASAWNAQDMVDDGGALSATVAGAASIALPDATLFVAEGWHATALAIGGWMLERNP
jgi:N-methylhydantoinase A